MPLLGPPFLDPIAAVALVAAGATVLDTRSLPAYLAGHIPGAVRVDWRIGTVGGAASGTLGDPATVAAAFAALGVDADRPVLVVGSWTAGWGEEGRIVWDLTWLGHPEARLLVGGMDAWPGPREHLPARPRPGRLAPHPRAALRATTTSLAAALAGPNRPVILDVREPVEYDGARLYGEARGGHVPGATNVPWRALLAEAPTLASATPIVTYCTGGVRSAMAWVTLTGRGYTHVANYDGSWWEWAREKE
jgi:thiosulfate/3-mercaptopyruvate sulfurtransferase